MPAGVVVVKRTRARAFAPLWAALAWGRSLAASLRGEERGRFSATAARPGEAVFPALVQTAKGPGRCTACGECVSACPSRCLSVAGEAARPIRFQLDPGACIGCARCVEICPEAALEGTPVPSFLLPGPSGRVEAIDLLRDWADSARPAAGDPVPGSRPAENAPSSKA